MIRGPLTKKEAVAALDAFADSYAPKYTKAVECLTKDRDALLAFYDFPAEHWKHLRSQQNSAIAPLGTAKTLGLEVPPALRAR